MNRIGKTPEQLWSMFDYIDGVLYWKEKTISRGRKSTKGGTKVWTKSKRDGYLRVGFNSKQHLVHRVIFLMHYGYIPECLDHIDGNRENNKIENLRPASKYQNILNSKVRSDNTSGVKGVCWNARKRKWFARIHFEKKPISLGYYVDLELADLVVQEARVLYHKEFANHGKHTIH
jgi:hypothetical protein